jgi:large repetitive protein
MGTAREGQTAARLPDGRVLIFGGATPAAQYTMKGLATSEVYDPATGTFSPGPSMTTERQYYSAIPLADGRILAVGGYVLDSTGVVQLSSAEVYWP